MKSKKILGLLGAVALAIVLTLAFLPGCAKEAPAPAPAPEEPQPTVLEAVTIFVQTHRDYTDFTRFADFVKDMSDGELIIDWKGSGEVIPVNEMAMAVSQNVIDMAVMYAVVYESLVPAIGVAGQSSLTPEQERAPDGIIDLWREAHEKVGLYFLGRLQQYNKNQYVQIAKKVEHVSDLKGMKMGGIPGHRYFYNALGAEFVAVPAAEYYTSLERGLMDGALQGFSGTIAKSLYEVCPYFIDHPLGRMQTFVIINLDIWKGLPPHLQQVLHEALVKNQPFTTEHCDRDSLETRRILVEEHGVTPIKFPPDEAEVFKNAYQSIMTETLKKYPDFGPRWLEALQP